MKHRLSLLLLTLLSFCLQCTYAADPLRDKSLRKECQEKTRQLKADGWAVRGGTQSLDAALTAYYGELSSAGSEAQTLVVSEAADTENAAYRRAETAATGQHARLNSSSVNAETLTRTEPSSKAGTAGAVSTSRSARTQTKARTEKLHPALELVRTRQDGKSEVMLFYIVSH